MELASSRTGEYEGGAARAASGFEPIGVQSDALFMMTLVEETETIAAKGGRSALRAVDLDVLTAIGKCEH